MERPAFGITVVGSGGPFANPRRASAGYVIWCAGRPAILLDAGGGAHERLGLAGIDPAAIDLVLLSHLHIDHSGGLPPVVFAAAIAKRGRPFDLVGPQARANVPGTRAFAQMLFGEQGAWSYLNTFDGFGVRARELPAESDAGAPTSIDSAGVAVDAIASVPVPHGMMPAVAYRIERSGRSICYSGDVSEASDALIALARGCDLLVHDLALPERDVENGELHAKPSAVGRVAAAAGCKRLLVTHVMPELEDEIDDALAQILAAYDGEITVARDLLTIALT